jgi:hypothetical protein
MRFPGMDTEQTPINGKLDRRRKLPTAVPSAVEGTVLAFKDRVLWPLEDNLALLSDRGRIITAAGSALAVAAVAAVIVVLAGSGGSGEQAAAQVALAGTPPAGSFGIPPAPSPPAPTLHGATPTFKAPAGKPKQDSSGVDAAKAVESSPPTSPAAATSAATDPISSQPSSTTGAATTSAEAEAASIPGPEAGAKAIAVARKFSDAFVVYETGGEQSAVRPVFAKTTTPDLAKALLKRPPRLPADVKVPKAKVLNVVAGPSREGVFTLSVSLLRLGVTSELRLEMEQLKDEGWRVTNVLG